MTEFVITGDSWSYGSEIINPKLNPNIDEWDSTNTEYRESHIFPTILGTHLNVNSIRNLSFPAYSNDSIFRQLYKYLFTNYIHHNKSLDNVFVLVQLTSFDRIDYYYENENKKLGQYKTIWPNWKHDYNDYAFNMFADNYSRFIEHDMGNLTRYVNQIFNFQNFCKIYKIPHLIVQGFYHTNYSPNILQWYDSKYINNINTQSIIKRLNGYELKMWNEIDSIRFMNKDDENHSLHHILKSYQIHNPNNSVFLAAHPNELGHTIIAEELYEYIKKYNLLSFN